MTPKQYKILIKVRDLRKQIDELESTVLKLMAHPEATPEHLRICHQMCVDLGKRRAEVNAQLQKHNIKL